LRTSNLKRSTNSATGFAPRFSPDRYFFELRPSDLALHALVGVVDVNPEVEVVQPLRDFPRVLHVPVSDWDDTRLDGREPNRKRAGGGSMLLPLALCAADTSSCITSQCSAILPLATRKMSTIGLSPHPK